MKLDATNKLQLSTVSQSPRVLVLASCTITAGQQQRGTKVLLFQAYCYIIISRTGQVKNKSEDKHDHIRVQE